MTDATESGLLGHGVYEVDGHAVGWFTAFADTRSAVDALVRTARESPRTDAVREFDDHGTRMTQHPEPGNATRGLLAEYGAGDRINGAIVSRGSSRTPRSVSSTAGSCGPS